MKVMDTIQTVYSVGSLDFVILKESLIFLRLNHLGNGFRCVPLSSASHMLMC